MKRFALLLLVVVATTPAGAATPLFDRFKALCIDTGADPAAVKLAAEAAGGVAGPVQRMTDLVPMSDQMWILGHDVVPDFVMAGTESDPATARVPAHREISCSMGMGVRDPNGLARLRAWAGVKADRGGPKNTEFYSFLNIGGKHVAMPGDDASNFKAMAVGNAWLLTIAQINGRFDVMLLHYLPP